MKRSATLHLECWKNKPNRKPLLVYGARQVGKTYLLKEYGSCAFEKVAYFDLERQAEARLAFEGDLSPEVIVSKLSQVLNASIDIDNTLIILDEVQASNRALASLKYFYEEMPQACVIAAGSLLGVALHREGYSAPVGKVETYTLYPMTFDEFLYAQNQDALVEGIKQSYLQDTPYFLHEKALSWYHIYLLVGGMPEAVEMYRSVGDFSKIAQIQNSLLDLYVADMAKYARPFETARIMEAWQSVPAQLAKENKKFQYKTVRSGGRASQYEAALAWLEAAGLVNRCVQITSGRLPLALHENREIFKIYLADTGLLSARMNIHSSMLLEEGPRRQLDTGFLTENYVAQALASQDFDLLYWVSKGKAEVDFVLDFNQIGAVPLEVKSSTNVRSKSLSVYCDKYQPAYALRLSTKNFGFENGVRSVPLYAAFCLSLQQG